MLALPGSCLLQQAPHLALIHLQATRRTGGPGRSAPRPGAAAEVHGLMPGAGTRGQGAARSPASDMERTGYALTWQVQPPGPQGRMGN